MAKSSLMSPMLGRVMMYFNGAYLVRYAHTMPAAVVCPVWMEIYWHIVHIQVYEEKSV